MSRESLIQKHREAIDFLKKHDGLIDWDDPSFTPEMIGLIFDAIPDIIRRCKSWGCCTSGRTERREGEL